MNLYEALQEVRQRPPERGMGWAARPVGVARGIALVESNGIQGNAAARDRQGENMRVTLPVYATFEVPDEKEIPRILEAVTNGAYTYYDPENPKAMRAFQLSATRRGASVEHDDKFRSMFEQVFGKGW